MTLFMEVAACGIKTYSINSLSSIVYIVLVMVDFFYYI